MVVFASRSPRWVQSQINFISSSFNSLYFNKICKILLDLDINRYNSFVITGETGSGKSVLLDQIILQMISKYTSEELRLILIDTAGVELNYYKDTNICATAGASSCIRSCSGYCTG